MPIPRVRTISLVILAALLFAPLTGAGAQQPTQAQADAIRRSCRGDYQAYCSSVPAGGSGALQCLKDNAGSLSANCRTAVAATGTPAAPAPAAQGAPAAPQAATPTPRMEAATLRRACGGDFRALCPGVRLGGGRALACLSDHRESLSPACREAVGGTSGR